MQIIVIGARPANQERLKEIWLHDEILFLDTLEDYQQWCTDRQIAGKPAPMVIINDVEKVVRAKPNPRYFTNPHLAALLAKMDFSKLEERILAAQVRGDSIMVGSYMGEAKQLKEILPQAIEPIPDSGRTRRSKGEKHANRRHRWC